MEIFSTSIRILPKDNKSHVSVEFDVPSGLKSLSVATSYAPKYEYDEKKCIALIDEGLSAQDLAQPLTFEEKRLCVPLASHIAWSLEDGEKLIGTEHRHNPNQVHVISEVYSSNGFAKTKIIGGKWKLIASINNIVTDYIDINIRVTGSKSYPQIPASADYGRDDVRNDSADGKLSWQRVEMHCHTVASDGDMQPEELVQNAIKRGYKAICLTDHNTTSNVDEVKKYGEKYGLVVAGGIEWTTFWGHLTVVGGASDVKWTDITKDNINACIKRAREAGDIVTVAHPKRIGSPLCAGCHNQFELDWAGLSAYEVWSHYNPSVSPYNLLAKKEWISLLDKGYKISVLYGYDWHSPDEGAPTYAYTYLGVDGKLTQESVVKAVQEGRTYITMGYKVTVSAWDGENVYGIGDTVNAGQLHVCVKVQKLEDYPYDSKLEKIVLCSSANGEFALDVNDGEDKIYFSSYFKKSGYVRVEGRGKVDGKDSDVFITGPIYIKE